MPSPEVLKLISLRQRIAKLERDNEHLEAINKSLVHENKSLVDKIALLSKPKQTVERVVEQPKVSSRRRKNVESDVIRSDDLPMVSDSPSE